jgi:hypothetical protein
MPTYTWIHDTASRWDYAANWSTDDPTPTYPGVGDNVIFNGTHKGDCQCYNGAYADSVTNTGGYTGELNLRRALTVSGDFIWEGGKLTGSYGLNVGGDCNLTGCTYTSTITLTLNTPAGASKILTATQTFGNLNINGGAGSTTHIVGSITVSYLMAEGVGSLQVDSGTPTVTGTLELITGTFDAGTINLSGILSMGSFGGGNGTINWTQAGNLSWNTGGPTTNLPGIKFNSNRIITAISTVTFAETDVIQGTINLPYIDANAYKFTNGKSFIVRSGATVNFAGTSLHNVLLREKAGGSVTWVLDNQSGSIITADYVDVEGSVASNSITPTNSTDSGGNINWEFPSLIETWVVTCVSFNSDGGVVIPPESIPAGAIIGIAHKVALNDDIIDECGRKTINIIVEKLGLPTEYYSAEITDDVHQ